MYQKPGTTEIKDFPCPCSSKLGLLNRLMSSWSGLGLRSWWSPKAPQIKHKNQSVRHVSREHKTLERLGHKNVKHGRGKENRSLQHEGSRARETRQNRGDTPDSKGKMTRKDSKETMRGQHYSRQEGKCWQTGGRAALLLERACREKAGGR